MHQVGFPIAAVAAQKPVNDGNPDADPIEKVTTEYGKEVTSALEVEVEVEHFLNTNAPELGAPFVFIVGSGNPPHAAQFFTAAVVGLATC